MKNKQLLFCFLIILFTAGCRNKNVTHPSYNFEDKCENDVFLCDSIPVLDFPLEKRAYSSVDSIFFTHNQADAHGIAQFLNDSVLTYHPVIMAQYALKLLEVYRKTGDSLSLNIAKEHAAKFIELSDTVNDALLFPYDFDCYFFDRDTMLAPWYSGMAQGQVLSVFSRLFELTDDSTYAKTAAKIFNSFYLMKGQNTPWISCIDNHGDLWIEEYPHKAPSHVLNGNIFAIYGIYDYYQISKEADVLLFSKAAISTVRKNMNEYREKDLISYYCLKYNVRNYGYQDIHIAQFYQLEKMTSLFEFKTMAQDMRQDQTNAPPKP